MFRTKTALLAALILSCAPTFAQANETKECPRDKVVDVPGRATTISEISCGYGISFSAAGFRIDHTRGKCPLLTEYVPPHSTTEHDLASATYTMPEGFYEVRVYVFECNSHWFLGIIPIEVASTCDFVRSDVAARRFNYVQHPCDY